MEAQNTAEKDEMQINAETEKTDVEASKQEPTAEETDEERTEMQEEEKPGDEEDADTSTLKEERIQVISKYLKDVRCEVAFLVERNKRLEGNIDSIAELLKQSDDKETFEVDGETVS